MKYVLTTKKIIYNHQGFRVLPLIFCNLKHFAAVGSAQFASFIRMQLLRHPLYLG